MSDTDRGFCRLCHCAVRVRPDHRFEHACRHGGDAAHPHRIANISASQKEERERAGAISEGGQR